MIKRAAKVLIIGIVCLGIASFSSEIFAASLKSVTGTPGQSAYDSAINQNFDRINNELGSVVHRGSTETITGYKYFTNPVDFGSVVVDTGTFSSLTATAGTITTLTATTLSVTSITLNGLLYAGNPVGTVVMYVSATAPSGWKLCDGASLSTTTYSRLFSVIGYTYGGSGANFSAPDFRGVFPKGSGTTDRAAGKDSAGNFYAGTLGTYSTDKMQGHKHNLTYYGSDVSSVPMENDGTNGNGKIQNGAGADISQPFSVASPISDGTNGTPRTGLTTEPQSLGINFIIYAGL